MLRRLILPVLAVFVLNLMASSALALRTGKLEVQGDITMNNSKMIGLGSGKGLLQFIDDTQDYLGIMNGWVGIGTTTPTMTLEVVGNIKATGGNSDQWNQAYGWGNHAAAGYTTAAGLASALGTFETTASLLSRNYVSTGYLGTWAGSSNITTLGTITSGTVPAANVSGLATSATIDATNASNISSGTLSDSRLSSNVALKSYVDGAVGTFEPSLGTGTSTQYLRGDKTWQDLNAAAVSGLAASATTDTTNASNISSGTLDDGRLSSNVALKSYVDGAVSTFETTSSLLSRNYVNTTYLGTWAGSTNITTLGTITTGTVPAANVSGLATSATLDATNASNISSGTLSDSRLSSNVALKSYVDGAVGTFETTSALLSRNYVSTTYLGTWAGSSNITTVGTLTGPLAVSNTIESTSGGFKFPDGTTQTTAASVSFKQTFTNATLSGGNLTVTHSLNSQFVNCKVYDNNNQVVMPDEITATDANTLTVNFASFGTLTGNWNIVVAK